MSRYEWSDWFDADCVWSRATSRPKRYGLVLVREKPRPKVPILLDESDVRHIAEQYHAGERWDKCVAATDVTAACREWVAANPKDNDR